MVILKLLSEEVFDFSAGELTQVCIGTLISALHAPDVAVWREPTLTSKSTSRRSVGVGLSVQHLVEVVTVWHLSDKRVGNGGMSHLIGTYVEGRDFPSGVPEATYVCQCQD